MQFKDLYPLTSDIDILEFWRQKGNNIKFENRYYREESLEVYEADEVVEIRIKSLTNLMVILK